MRKKIFQTNNFVIFEKKNMKNFFIILVVFFSYNLSFSQNVELKTYCFGNNSHDLVKKLSPESKLIFSNLLEKHEIDTSNLYRVNYDDVFNKYGMKSYLSVHSYKYINWSRFDSLTKIKEYHSSNNYPTFNPSKLIILYSTNNSNLEDLSIYLIK